MSNSYDEKLKCFAKEWFEVEAIKFGNYKTKAGLMTPVYCDLRVIVSYPKMLDTLADFLIEKISKIENIEIVCGVPYTALPIATAVSLKTLIPMVMRRKEAKNYGTKNLIEGAFTPGQNCLIVEDVVTSGSSILETVKDLNDVKIECRDAIILLNREQGGEEFLKKNGIKIHSLLCLTQLIVYLRDFGCIDDSVVDDVRCYLATTQISDKSIAKGEQDQQNFVKMSNSYDEKLKCFAKELFEVDAIKFGNYKTKAGLMTPVYCDLRVIVSYPKMLDTLADLLKEKISKIENIEIVCGVPYTALPIATAVSLKTLIPMVMRRKEAKNYGTKNLIEGAFTPGQNCLIVEDVVTSGSSILETVKDLNDVKIECRDAIILLNREQGGEEFLKKNGIKIHSLLCLTQLIVYLRDFGCIDDSVVEDVRCYLATTQISDKSIAKGKLKIISSNIKNTKQINMLNACRLTQ